MDLKDNKIMILQEELDCANLYLDDLGAPRKSDNDEEYTIVGRIQQIQKKHKLKISELENFYLNNSVSK